MLITLDHVTKYYGATLVLQDITAAINPGDRIGLIGPNGAGKTTLLGLIGGELDADSGQIARLPRLRMGYFHQSAEQELRGTIGEELYAPFRDILATGKQLDEAARRLAGLDPESDTGRQAAADYDRLNTAFEVGEGYLVDVKVNTVVEGMGFRSFDRDMQTSLLSGGERTRLGLMKLLLAEPDLLILDEVTNHLDFAMLDFLEGWLARYKGAVLTVSHDRYYLGKSTNKTWELEDKQLITYPAAYDAYLPLKAQREALIEKEYERYIAEKARLEDYVQRNIVRATTANMAKSRIKMIEHLDEKPPPAPKPKPPHIRFTERRQPVKDVLSVSGLSLSAGEGGECKHLFDNLDVTVTRGERIAVIGPNGVGKSSLFGALNGERKPDAGSIEWGRGTDISYYAQDDNALQGRDSVLDYLWDRFPSQDAHTLRSTLGGVGITGEAVHKSVAVLSGGEKAKVKLAAMFLEQGNVLLMDEPTNHLDIPAKERLEEAMKGFTGTIIAISHDRHFLTAIPTRIIELTPGGGRSYEGNYTDYLRLREAESAREAAAMPPPQPEDKKPTAFHRTKKQRSAQQALRGRIARCEEAIAAGEARVAEIEAQLADPATAANYEQLMALTDELHARQGEGEGLLQQWEDLHSELDAI